MFSDLFLECVDVHGGEGDVECAELVKNATETPDIASRVKASFVVNFWGCVKWRSSIGVC